MVTESPGRDGVHVASRRYEMIFQVVGPGGEHHARSAAIRGIGFAADQVVAFHSLQGVGHGRLLDPDQLAQLALGQPVGFEQGQHLGELTGHNPDGRDPSMQGRSEQAAEMVDLVAQRRISGQGLRRPLTHGLISCHRTLAGMQQIACYEHSIACSEMSS